jgi:hypothetical protein
MTFYCAPSRLEKALQDEHGRHLVDDGTVRDGRRHAGAGELLWL